MMKHALMIYICCIAAAEMAADDCSTCCGCSAWAEAIWARPTTGPTDWAATANIGPTSGPATSDQAVGLGASGLGDARVDRQVVCPEYSVGFRVGIDYQAGCRGRYATASLTNIDFNDGANASSSNLYPALPFIFAAEVSSEETSNLVEPSIAQNSWGLFDGHGRANLKARYWDADLRAGQCISHDCGLDFSAFAGVRYVDICETLSARCEGTRDPGSKEASDVRIDQTRRREFSGVGPEIGIGLATDMCGCYYARGEIIALAIIGSSKGWCKSSTQSSPQNGEVMAGGDDSFERFNGPRCTTVVPGLEARLAVGLGVCWCSLESAIELGYTVTHFWNVLSGVSGIASSNIVATTRSSSDDFGFAGPYLGLRLQF
jgi:Legionella pneumophila major outer membrane protein precursor